MVMCATSLVEEARVSRDELRRVQLRRLKWSLRQAWKVPYIRRKWKEAGVSPESLRTLEDLRKFPFTTVHDIRRNFPFGLLAVPPSRVTRIHMSSGTTGDPKVMAYTARDVEVWSRLMARGLALIGVTEKDILVNTSNHNVFTGGLGILQGAEMLGAAAIPLGPVGSERTLELISKLGATAIHAIPSFGLRLAETARKLGVDTDVDLHLRIGVFGAEPWSEGARRRIEEGLGLTAYDNYGLTELCGPGVAIECMERDGLHVWSDYFIPEVVDRETGEPLGDGEEGELVLTALWREAIPMIRYRTGDLCSMTHEPCGCGLAHPRISRIKGRVDDMLIVKGVNVFPSQIESVVMEFGEVTDNFQIEVWRRGPYKELTVRVEVRDEFWERRGEIKRRMEERLRAVTFLGMEVECVREGIIPRTAGKARRVVDRGEEHAQRRRG